jgi:hypothetical protein
MISHPTYPKTVTAASSFGVELVAVGLA